MLQYRKKRWLLLVLMLIFAMALTACGGDDDDDGDSEDDNGNDAPQAESFSLDQQFTADLGDAIVIVNHPTGWVTSTGDDNTEVWLANSEEAFAKTQSDPNETEPAASGEVVMLVAPIPAPLPPDQVVDLFRSSPDAPFTITGENEDVTIGNLSGVRVQVENPVAEGYAYFVTYDETFVLAFFGFTAAGEYTDELDSNVRAMMQTVTITAPATPDGEG